MTIKKIKRLKANYEIKMTIRNNLIKRNLQRRMKKKTKIKVPK